MDGSATVQPVGRVAMNGTLRARARLWFAVRRAGASISLPFRVTGRGASNGHRTVAVGPGTRIGQFAWISLTSPQARVEIGRNCTINSNFTATVRGAIHIGDGVGIGDRTIVMDHEHARSGDASTGFSWALTEPRPVTIESGVHIGVNVVIMPGVTIGENAVVGANAVVTRSVPPGGVVAGVPARRLGPS